MIQAGCPAAQDVLREAGKTAGPSWTEVHMQVQTTRFGTVEVAEERVLTFPSGLLGFASYRRFVLLQPDEEGVFYWLQSADTPELAFVVTDPCLWADEYQAVIRQEQLDMMGISGITGAQLFVIVNKYDDTLTANFQGPLVINLSNQQGMQLVLADRKWTTRHEIARLAEGQKAASA